MQKLFYIACGGALGAMLRYGAAGVVHSAVSSMFPWGTLAVNLVGTFAAGLLWYLAEELMIAPQARLFLFVGLLGSFTTFSTYMLETLALFRDGETGLALWNLLLHNVLGALFVFAGLVLAQLALTCLK